MRTTHLASTLLVAAACGGGGQTPVDAPPIDAPPIDVPPPLLIDEAPDCGGDAIVARQGDLQLIVNRMLILTLGDSFDLDGDGVQDNKLSALASLTTSEFQDGVTMGTYAVPIEIFDRTGDPDPCVKLAWYRGACVGTCNFTDATQDTVSLDPASFAAGDPISRMRSMSTDAVGALTADPGILFVILPSGGAGDLGADRKQLDHDSRRRRGAIV